VFADNLSFPHGVAARADGRYVAITTFGDDSVHIAAAAAAPSGMYAQIGAPRIKGGKGGAFP